MMMCALVCGACFGLYLSLLGKGMYLVSICTYHYFIHTKYQRNTCQYMLVYIGTYCNTYQYVYYVFGMYYGMHCSMH